MNKNYVRIWEQVEKIPLGKVATYGQIADLAGLPGCARVVGNALKNTPANSDLPWHRVLNAQGRCSSPNSLLQRKKLLAEQVQFVGERVVLAEYQMSLDYEIWQP